MKISVISPMSHTGTSLASILLSHALAHTQSLTTMLTFTGQNKDVCNYLGVSQIKDKTRTVSQVVSLLESRAIDPKDLYDYSIKASINFNVMDTVDETLSPEDSAKLMAFVFKNIPSDVAICDMSTDIYDDVTQELFDVSDIVCVVINPDNNNYDMLKKWQESAYWPKKARILLLVNKYDERVDALRNISKRLGYVHSNVCKIHYNPLLTRACNRGEILSVTPEVADKDPRVIELNSDLKECSQFISSIMGTRFKWGE